MGWFVPCLVVLAVAVTLVRRNNAPPTAPPPPPPPATAKKLFSRENSLFDVEGNSVAGAPEGVSEAHGRQRESTPIAPELTEPVDGGAASDSEAEDISVETPAAVLSRRDFVPKEDEQRYLARSDDGSLVLRLVDAGDRLAIWSPVDGGGLINPRGPGLRSLGLYSSYVRGSEHYRGAYRNADLRPGQRADLKREPENPHDKNAVALCAPGSDAPFGYVQRGRAVAIAKRLDAGEALVAVSMRGPARGRSDDSAVVIIGSRADLSRMLSV